MKDNFSAQAKLYAQFRPTYPPELYSFILSLVEKKDKAWDCGTGNGQVAQVLAAHFKEVCATDISSKQLEQAPVLPNVLYRIEGAENSSFGDNSFDLITVAQAVHWFDFDKFYATVHRTMQPNGILALVGYGLLYTDPETDAIIQRFYTVVIGSYWDKERKYIDENYRSLPFPFTEIEMPPTESKFEWALPQLLGYLETWSAVQHYIKANNHNPIELIADELKAAWPENEIKTVRFPIISRIGTVK
jgi:SAM-dependent methyltransferase